MSSCSSREEGESTECGRVFFGCSLMMISFCRRASECGRASARSLGCSLTMISFCRRVSDCEELESEELESTELEGAEEATREDFDGV